MRTSPIVIPALFALLVSSACALETAEPTATRRQEYVLPPAPTAPGWYVRSLIHDGLERSYGLYLPTGYGPKKSFPLLAILHGGGDSAEGFAASPGMADLKVIADRDGWVVVFLQAAPGTSLATRDAWEFDSAVRDDLGYCLAVLDRVSGIMLSPPTGTFVAGFSRGGGFAQWLGRNEPSRFTAIASVEGYYSLLPSVPATSPATNTNLPVLLIHQDGDPVVPYQGGTTPGGSVSSAQDDYATWYGNNRCTALTSTLSGQVKDIESTACTTGSTPYVELVTVHAKRHTWPAASSGYDASSAVTAFFAAQ